MTRLTRTSKPLRRLMLLFYVSFGDLFEATTVSSPILIFIRRMSQPKSQEIVEHTVIN